MDKDNLNQCIDMLDIAGYDCKVEEDENGNMIILIKGKEVS